MKVLAVLVMAAAASAVPAAHAQSTLPAAAPAAAPAAPAPSSADTGARTAAVTREAWIDVGKSVRAPLGAVKSRRQTSSVFTRTLPGVPEGEYVVIQYATDFASRAGVIETVVPMRQADGSWKVTTYRFR
ncbi:MAG: hypothetical protein JWP72_208 [Massilia sp.]|nr:hypothetical protein [Massilia sp.]MDB5792610.1 hypothetical protein [Massilia sp.]